MQLVWRRTEGSVCPNIALETQHSFPPLYFDLLCSSCLDSPPKKHWDLSTYFNDNSVTFGILTSSSPFYLPLFPNSLCLFSSWALASSLLLWKCWKTSNSYSYSLKYFNQLNLPACLFRKISWMDNLDAWRRIKFTVTHMRTHNYSYACVWSNGYRLWKWIQQPRFKPGRGCLSFTFTQMWLENRNGDN